MIQANQSVITDLSKLGKPGDEFVHDFFLPGTQLTFPQTTAAQIAKVDGVASVSSGLVLAAVHQSGRCRRSSRRSRRAASRSRSIGRSPPSDRGRVRRDAGVPRRRRASRSAATRAEAQQRPARAARPAAASAAAVAAARRRRPERVRQVPAGAAAALPRHDHDAGADAAAGRQPAADEHQELQLHDRGRRSDDAGHRRRHRRARLERPLHRREQGRGRPRGAALEHLREPARPEGRLEARPQRHDVHGRRPRAAAARRPDRRRLHLAAAAAGAREPEGLRQRAARPGRERCVGRRRAEADRDALPAGAGREREAGRRLDQRLARRRREPLEAARDGARRARRGRRVPARRAAHALVGRQARARARHAQGARLDAVARRAPGDGRVARPGHPRRARRRRPRRRRDGCDRRLRADADRQLEHGRRRRLLRAR